MNYSDYVLILKALADETRLKIVNLLSNGEMCACKILEHFKITQPTLSYHMKILCESNIVTGIRNGAWMNYSLNKDAFDEMGRFFLDVSENKGLNSKCDCKC